MLGLFLSLLFLIVPASGFGRCACITDGQEQRLRCTGGSIADIGQYKKCPNASIIDFHRISDTIWTRLNIQSREFAPFASVLHANLNNHNCDVFCVSILFTSFDGNVTSNCGCSKNTSSTKITSTLVPRSTSSSTPSIQSSTLLVNPLTTIKTKPLIIPTTRSSTKAPTTTITTKKTPTTSAVSLATSAAVKRQQRAVPYVPPIQMRNILAAPLQLEPVGIARAQWPCELKSLRSPLYAAKAGDSDSLEQTQTPQPTTTVPTKQFGEGERGHPTTTQTQSAIVLEVDVDGKNKAIMQYIEFSFVIIMLLLSFAGTGVYVRNKGLHKRKRKAQRAVELDKFMRVEEQRV